MISNELHREILGRLGVSKQTLSRRARLLQRAHGPGISSDEARGIIAAELGIDLAQYGWTSDQMERIRKLRADGAGLAATPGVRAERITRSTDVSTGKRSDAAEPTARRPSRQERFDGRRFHERVVISCRKAFVTGLNQDAVLRAFRSVNNRVKRLTGSSRDGTKLMAWAFSEQNPELQMSKLETDSQVNEQAGLRSLIQGAMQGIRNPRAHEDHWEPDDDEEAVLELLSFASFLHRCLDRCESFRQT